MSRILALLLALLAATPAAAQIAGQFPPNTVYAGPPSGGGFGEPAPRALLPADMGSVAGTAIGAYPGPGDPAVALGMNTGHLLCFLDSNCVFSGNGVFPLVVGATNPYVQGAPGSTINSAVNGAIYSVRFASSHLAGSPVTVSYTASGVDTVSTIATNLCVNINATVGLYGTQGLPYFCQANGAGKFNIQWQSSYSDTALTSTGTGSITLTGPFETLDYAVTILGRRIPGYVGQNNDNVHCLEFMGQSSTGAGAMDGVAGILCGSLLTASNPSIVSKVYLAAGTGNTPQMGWSNGVILYDASGNQPTGGFLGAGWLNVPASAGYAVASQIFANNAGLFAIGANLFGGTAAGSVLNLQANNNGAPSGDFVQIKAGGVVGFKFDGATNNLLTNALGSGSILSKSATAGIGYATGAGGTIAQATSKSTGVTLNTASGAITLNAASLAAATIVSFTLTDSAIATTDLILANHISGGTTGAYTINCRASGAGTAACDVRNNTAGALAEAIVIQFAVIKGVTS